jgi:hypothetical protein
LVSTAMLVEAFCAAGLKPVAHVILGAELSRVLLQNASSG